MEAQAVIAPHQPHIRNERREGQLRYLEFCLKLFLIAAAAGRL
jgi:hypothetical protein